MNKILSNTSAMYWYDGMITGTHDLNFKIRPGTLVLGTTDGALYEYLPYGNSLEKIYQFSFQKSIQQIKVDRFYVVVLFDDGSVYRFYNGKDTKDCTVRIGGKEYRIKPFSDGPKLIGNNVDYIFSPYTMLMNDSTEYGAYLDEKDTIVKVRDLEYFEGDNIFDQSGVCIAINRFMSTASVYTLNMNDYTTWKKDTFSFEGEFMSTVAKVIQNSERMADNSKVGVVNLCLTGELDDEMVQQEEIMNSMLPESMVRTVHEKHTCLDFVKLYDSKDKNNPFVVTGGRDHRIIITDFISHNVFFNETFDDVPRCCCVSGKKIYIGCDNGTIVIINKSDYDFEMISIGEKDFKYIETNWNGRFVIAVNSDDMVFCIDTEKMELGGEFIEGGVKDIVVDCWLPKGDHAYVLTESGDLLQIGL